MGSIIQKLADEIKLHGSYENYCAWRENLDVSNTLTEVDEVDLKQDFSDQLKDKIML